jgi:hypothetical protein
MRKISFTHSDLADSNLITETCAGVRVYHRAPIAFALADVKNGEIYFGFESISLARVIEDLKVRIYDVRVVEVKVKVGFTAQTHTEIHLSVGIGRHVIVASHERVYISEQSYSSIPDADVGALLSPKDAWNLPTDGYRQGIRLTRRMAACIDLLANNESQSHILHIMWREYQLEISKFVEPLNPTIIDCEVVTFTALERADGLVVFDYA